jgi:ribosomal protein S18 acetylase RimI-like enzyme
VPAALALLARAQADPAQHIGYHGVTEAELADEFAGFEPDWASNAVLAVDESGRLAGVFSAEVDRELRRAWLYGPYVDVPVNHPAGSRIWDQTADRLFYALLELPLLAGIADLELFGHVQHRRLSAFAGRHGFAAGKPSRIMVLDGAGLRGLLLREAGPGERDRGIRELPEDPAVRRAVAVLHDRCFPNTYLSGLRLAENDRTVVVAQADGVQGYAVGRAQQDEYFVDFVGVEPAARGTGLGPALVTELVWALAARHGARPRVAASVARGNEPSERMFGKLDFHAHLDLISYRRRPGRE